MRRATSSVNTADQEARFLSTLSLRRATQILDDTSGATYHFYPRSPCGERQLAGQNYKKRTKFLSTLSLRRATYDTYAKVLRVNISIHALLAESDGGNNRKVKKSNYFYPRSPCGERPRPRYYPMGRHISIHALLAESDHPAKSESLTTYFISIHALLAESDNPKIRLSLTIMISIHALLAESDGGSGAGNSRPAIFLSTLSLRRATFLSICRLAPAFYFYPRSPCGERR